MLCGYLPFDDDQRNPESANVGLLYDYILQLDGRPVYPDWVLNDCHDVVSLIDGMLQVNPTKRMTMDDVVAHPWLDSVRGYLNQAHDYEIFAHLFDKQQQQTSASDVEPFGRDRSISAPYSGFRSRVGSIMGQFQKLLKKSSRTDTSSTTLPPPSETNKTSVFSAPVAMTMTRADKKWWKKWSRPRSSTDPPQYHAPPPQPEQLLPVREEEEVPTEWPHVKLRNHRGAMNPSMVVSSDELSPTDIIQSYLKKLGVRLGETNHNQWHPVKLSGGDVGHVSLVKVQTAIVAVELALRSSSSSSKEPMHFAMEVCSVKSLNGVYYVDIHRVKGDAWLLRDMITLFTA
jgi:serine/threonine protein kinase